MAVYYISPYTTTNGTGTWASPFSFSSSTRTGFVAGDELRIVAKDLTSLLTATSYTATRGSATQITITSGGGLGADFVATEYVYFPDYDSFAYISSVSGNNLNMSSAFVPIPNTQNVTLNVRKVDAAIATPSATNVNMFLLNAPYANTAVTDGWVADGVQVTDGTAKSLVRSTTTSTPQFNMDGPSTVPYYLATANFTIDIPNTHALGSRSSSGALNIIVTNPTIFSIGQIYTPSGNCAIVNIANAVPYKTVTYTIKHFNCTGNPYQSWGGLNSVVNITNLYTTTTLTTPNGLINSQINIGTLVFNSLPLSSIFASGSLSISPCTINIGTIDVFQSASITGLTGCYGPYTLNLTGLIYFNRRLSTDTTAYRFYATGASGLNYTAVAYVPKVTVPAGITVPGNDYAAFAPPFAVLLVSERGNPKNIPELFILNAQGPIDNLVWIFAPRNLLITYTDGASPVECLGVGYAQQPTNTLAVLSEFPLVSLDAAVYRTTGPSMKTYLATYTAEVWSSPVASFGTKTIKIPVVAGTTYTISGYIRTDQTTFANGQCVVALTDSVATLTSQSMTTACINAWEQFSFSYTAAATQEIYLAISMQFSAGAKSFWIDDLTIV